MDLTLDEQRLIAEYRRLTPAGRDDLLAYASTLVRQAGEEKEDGTATGQCRLKSAEQHPEADKTPIFTE
ncbi:MAG: hypothetical protein ABSA86_07195 [Oryzomonas sp.]|jgi:hypothetical protein